MIQMGIISTHRDLMNLVGIMMKKAYTSQEKVISMNLIHTMKNTMKMISLDNLRRAMQMMTMIMMMRELSRYTNSSRGYRE